MFEQEQTIQKLDKKDFKYIEMGYAKPESEYGFSRNHFGERDIVPRIRKERKNIGLYRTSFWYDNMDPYEANLFGDFYMDFDDEEDVDKAREDLLFVIWKLHLDVSFGLPMEAFRIYFSGKKGFHLIIPAQYLGIEPRKNLDEIFKWIGQELNEESLHQTLDLVVYERRRLFRLENSIHQDTGLYKIPLQYKEVVNSTAEEIMDLARKNRRLEYPMPYLVMSAQKEFQRYIEEYADFLEARKHFKPKGPTIAKGETPEVVQELIDQGPVKGTRNETTAALASFWKNQGYEEEEIFDLLLEWNQGSQPEGDIRKTMKSILKRDLNYGLNRFKSLLEGDVDTLKHDKDQYKEYKKGRLRR